jgi:hypothetical protein
MALSKIDSCAIGDKFVFGYYPLPINKLELLYPSLMRNGTHSKPVGLYGIIH